ncbi:MAG: FdhD protein [Verrucomicrobia bacterium]|nr:MAG: FdhD protein [Verrucomicrobiota bacterium]
MNPVAREVELLRCRRADAAWNTEAQGDFVAVEEPLEIRVEGRGLAVVMRTPGHDRELTAGFLRTEGIIRSVDDLFDITPCGAEESRGNVVEVFLRDPDSLQLERLTRHVFSGSSCGICGKATIDSVFLACPPVVGGPVIAADFLLGLPRRLREAQIGFERTGGLHASAIFSVDGQLQCLREDAGRHNALDKVIGRALLEGGLPLANSVLLVSGRISFELMQKALVAGIPVVAGISAPSSLAIDLARESGQTLAGFVREGGFNLYAGAERVSFD